MGDQEQILALLLARKVFDGRSWRAYDAAGVEIQDPGGVLSKGVHGALLLQAALAFQDSAGGDGPAARNRFYVKHKGQLLLFDSLQEAHDYKDAVQAAEEAIAKAQKTSRRARKRARERFLAQVAPTPQESLEMALVERVQAFFKLPALPEVVGSASDVYMMRLRELAEQLQEDEAVTFLLFAA